MTKQPTHEILGFFFDFGKEAIRQSIPTFKGTQSSFKRSIENFYPDTPIPFCLKIEGSIDRYSEPKKFYFVSITVSFSENTEYIETEKMMEVIIENELLGGSSMPSFEPPSTFASKGYKDLVNSVLRKRNEQAIQHSGHSRETGSSTETVDGAGDQSQSGSDEG